MRTAVAKTILTFIAALALSACGSGEPRLLNVGAAADSPEEFAILPSQPLQAPSSYVDLPAPNSGGTNLIDPNPKADAVAALGGNPNVLSRSGIPVSDNALLSHTGRYGIQANIRTELASADVKLRKRNSAGLFRGFLGGNRYFAAYRRQSLDQYAELERLRVAGIKTPSAPPKP